MTTFTEIAERAEKADRPDRELNRAAARALGWHRVEPRHARSKHGGWIAPEDFIGTESDGAPILDGLHGTTIHRDVPDLTASLDAIQKIPGANISSSWRQHLKWCAIQQDAPKEYLGIAKTRPLAELAAVCRGKATKENDDG